jgi:hypothetical protein
MAFCGNCGHQLTGNEKFCGECGVETHPATSLPQPVPAQLPTAAPPPVDSPGPVPVPPASPAPPVRQKKGIMGTVVVVVAVALIGYYVYSRSRPPVDPAPSPAPAPAPAPAPLPAVQTPPPAVNPTGTDPAQLVAQQAFNAHWQDQSGMLVLASATWANNSDTPLASATLQCHQFNDAGTDLSMYRVTLDGPTAANSTSTFTNISLGATATGMTKVDCSIIHVKP